MMSESTNAFIVQLLMPRLVVPSAQPRHLEGLAVVIVVGVHILFSATPLARLTY
jgi:hypothetical protein